MAAIYKKIKQPCQNLLIFDRFDHEDFKAIGIFSFASVFMESI
jgi:hypothetical protein